MPRDDNESAVLRTITELFRAIEDGEWNTVRALLTDEVDIAHDRHQQRLISRQLADQWRLSHTGFATTRYRLQADHIEVTGARVEARFVSDVTLAPSGTADAVTITGEYAIELEQSNHAWKVRSIRHRGRR